MPGGISSVWRRQRRTAPRNVGVTVLPHRRPHLEGTAAARMVALDATFRPVNRASVLVMRCAARGCGTRVASWRCWTHASTAVPVCRQRRRPQPRYQLPVGTAAPITQVRGATSLHARRASARGIRPAAAGDGTRPVPKKLPSTARCSAHVPRPETAAPSTPASAATTCAVSPVSATSMRRVARNSGISAAPRKRNWSAPSTACVRLPRIAVQHTGASAVNPKCVRTVSAGSTPCAARISGMVAART